VDIEFPELTQQANKQGVRIADCHITEAIFSNRRFNKILKASNLNKDNFIHLKAYNFHWKSKIL